MAAGDPLPLDQPAELVGEWWVPDLPNEIASGRLTYEPYEPLRLEAVSGGGILSATDSIPWLHGLTVDGRFVTLRNLTVVNWSLSIPGGVLAQAQVGEAFVGMYAASAAALRLHSLEARIANLTAWLDPPGFALASGNTIRPPIFSLVELGRAPGAIRMLQGILERAVEWGRLQSNPARVVRKPSQKRQRAVRPLAPVAVEAMRTHLLRKGRRRDATLVAVLAYAGLRPGEALALTWDDVRGRTLLVDKSLSLGALRETKTGRTRTVKLLTPLANDLAEWRLASGRPAGDEPVFPTETGGWWTETAYRNWRRRIFATAAVAAGQAKLRPYDLRHSLASLLFAEGVNPAEIAEHSGTRSRRCLLRTRT